MYRDDMHDVGAMQFNLVPHANHILMLHGNSCSFFGNALLVVHELGVLPGVASDDSSTWCDGRGAKPLRIDAPRSGAPRARAVAGSSCRTSCRTS